MTENTSESTDQDSTPSKSKRRRGIYLLPNLFTTAALFCGFFAIIIAMKGDFVSASIAIFIAMVLDGLDGRVARMTNTQSAFGAEYDSLSDMVSFGLAPALVVYQWALTDIGKLGWLAAFVYAVSAALRLARFNTQIGIADKRYFQGLPSPAAAAIVAGLVWAASDLGLDPNDLTYVALFTVVLSGVLMVSNVRYHSFKELDLKGKVPFLTILLMVLVFVVISFRPPQLLFMGFMAYAVSGPVLTLVFLKKRRAERQARNDA